VNGRFEIWPWTNWGLTPEFNRMPVHGISRVIDEIATRFLDLQEVGGRFFIDATGAFYKADGRTRQFVNFMHRR
jgi:hypothetical protein